MSALAGPRAATASLPPPALVLVSPAEGVTVSPAASLLGLPLVRRTALAARRAGFGQVIWEGGSADAELRAALEGTAVLETTATPAGAVRLPWNAVMTVDSLRRLREKGDAGAAPVVRDRSDLRGAERFLLGSLVKQTDGFLARHVNRRISLVVSRFLAPTRVSPNQMTLVSVGFGLAGALFFFPGAPSLQLPGALLFLLHSILDGCDGELARLKFLESRWGGVLDFWGDNVVHAAVFAGLAVGWSRSIGAAWPLGLGALAVAGTLLSAGFVYRSTMWKPPSPGGPLFVSVTNAPATRVSRLADALARRDFIYLVVILAAVGEARWVLVMSAVGAPVFFLVLLAISRRGGHAERSPA